MKAHAPTTILIAYVKTEPHFNHIKQAAPQANYVTVTNPQEWEALADDIYSKIEIIYGRPPGSWISRMPNLRWIQLSTAGSDRLLGEAPGLKKSDIVITNSSGVHAGPISEHILALMLAFSRGLHQCVKSQQNHSWQRPNKVSELSGSTLGLIGVGRIGGKIAELAKALNMRVLGLRRNPDRKVGPVELMVGPGDRLRLFSQSDWVVVTAALTSETRGMIAENEFKNMKNSAHIINVARGPIINQKALIKSLRKGWIAGAGLDVFEEEPLPADSPLWDMPNVIITPHSSWLSPYHRGRRINIFIENLRRFQTGGQLINTVDKQRGY
jgi:phosphoglycerate dehydrogenase-like enzyme